MKIAYLTAYVGNEFMNKYGKGKHFSISGTLKSLGIARALMAAGHDVTIYSPGVTNCDAVIKAFVEYETYDEGVLKIKYCDIISKRKCDPINQVRISSLIRSDHQLEHFDILIYYNITLAAALLVSSLNDCKKVLEYEDNIFNKALLGDKNNFVWIKNKLYKHIISHSHGLISVCNGLMLESIPRKVLIPGVLNEDVINNVSTRVNKLTESKPVHIILTGGMHYSKGGDLLVTSMSYVKTPCLVSVYGNCELDRATKDLISQIPQYHKFEFHGYVPHSELIPILNESADIFINTTRSMQVGAQSAGFPFKMMEYAALGRPIVSSEIGKLDEDFNEHITYYDGEDPQKIADAIEQVIAKYDDKVAKALDLQKRVLNEFDIKGVARQLDVLLNSI